jgi:hypothetical protein
VDNLLSPVLSLLGLGGLASPKPSPSFNIYERQFDGDTGAANGSEVRLNLSTTGNYQFSSLVMNNMGHIVAVWSGPGDNGANVVEVDRLPVGQDNLDGGSFGGAPSSTEPNLSGPASEEPALPALPGGAAIGPRSLQAADSGLVDPQDGAASQSPVLPPIPVSPPATVAARMGPGAFVIASSAPLEKTPGQPASSLRGHTEEGEVVSFPSEGQPENETPGLEQESCLPAVPGNHPADAPLPVQANDTWDLPVCDACFTDGFWNLSSAGNSDPMILRSDPAEAPGQETGVVSLALMMVMGVSYSNHAEERLTQKRQPSLPSVECPLFD